MIFTQNDSSGALESTEADVVGRCEKEYESLLPAVGVHCPNGCSVLRKQTVFVSKLSAGEEALFGLLADIVVHMEAIYTQRIVTREVP